MWGNFMEMKIRKISIRGQSKGKREIRKGDGQA
jgi:hypothetical protein